MYYLVRWYWQGFTLQEIAVACEVTAQAIQKRLIKARIPRRNSGRKKHTSPSPSTIQKQKCYVRESRRKWRFKMQAEGRCTMCGGLTHKDWCERSIKKIW